MPLLSFQEQFVQAVENGLDLRAKRPLRHPGVRPKTQTIRAYWKNGHNPHRVGLTEYMWTKVRTPERRKLGEAVAKSVEPIRIARECEFSTLYQEQFARDDGFDTYSHMLSFFEKTHGLPFRGVLIRW